MWQAILAQIDLPGSESEFITASDSIRQVFHKHPWSIGGGGAAELKEHIEESCDRTLADVAAVVGVFGMTNSDESLLAPAHAFKTHRIEPDMFRPIVAGDDPRDWSIEVSEHAIFPYSNDGLINITSRPNAHAWLWPYRTTMGSRATFDGPTYFEVGRPWWEWHQVALERLSPPLTITFGEIATHNHFVIDRASRVFKQAAPIIKLPHTCSEDDHAGIVGLLNSSSACFWLKQVCLPKGGDQQGGDGARVRSTSGVETHVSHSSLSADERRTAEQAFADGGNCVIVATSTLELGIDVGDLDRVIQIDAPSKVASFLQRIGRTGRRQGSNRNCLFLATTSESLLQAAALVTLWRSGYVEPIQPPGWPIHLLGQQLLALLLQEKSVAATDWEKWLLRLPCFSAISRDDRAMLIEHLVSQKFIHDDEGAWMIGDETESKFGFRHFAEFTSVFTSPPVFEVWHGRRHVGTVDQANFFGSPDRRATLGLGGRSWKVVEISWSGRTVQVIPDEGSAKTRWSGSGKCLGFEMCQAIKAILCNDANPEGLSQRGLERIGQERADFEWLRTAHPPTLQRDDGVIEWWTFAGGQINRRLSEAIAGQETKNPSSDNVRLLVRTTDRCVLRSAIQSLVSGAIPSTPVDADSAPKFSELLPPHFRDRLIRQRLYQGLEREPTAGVLKAMLSNGWPA